MSWLIPAAELNFHYFVLAEAGVNDYQAKNNGAT
jgi:hypothetical protein